MNTMRKIIDLIESEIPANGEGYWVSPEGNVFPIDGQHHEFMDAFSNITGMQDTKSGDVNWRAEHQGWVRIIAFNFGRTVFLSSNSEDRCRNAYDALVGRRYVNDDADFLKIEIVSEDPFKPTKLTVDNVEEWTHHS